MTVFSLLLLWTVGYRYALGGAPCCLASVTALRCAGYALALWAALCCLLELEGAMPAELTADGLPRTDVLRPTEVLLLAGWGAVLGLLLLRLGSLRLEARRLIWKDELLLRPVAAELQVESCGGPDSKTAPREPTQAAAQLLSCRRGLP